MKHKFLLLLNEDNTFSVYRHCDVTNDITDEIKSNNIKTHIITNKHVSYNDVLKCWHESNNMFQQYTDDTIKTIYDESTDTVKTIYDNDKIRQDMIAFMTSQLQHPVFISNALGNNHSYSSSSLDGLEDYLHLYLKCICIDTEYYSSYKHHTNKQLTQVLADRKKYKITLHKKYNDNIKKIKTLIDSKLKMFNYILS